MTTNKFMDAVLAAATPTTYHAYLAICPAEVERTLDYIRQEQEAGHSFLPAQTEDVFATFAGDNAAPKSDAEEITAAAALLDTAPLAVCIETYHKQLSRPDAIRILEGALVLSRQPGASFGTGKMLVFPGYEATPHDFCRAWNEAHGYRITDKDYIAMPASDMLP